MAKKVMIRVNKGGTPIPTDTKFDLRDVLSGLVAKGNILNPDDKAALYGSLVSNIGQENAQKIMNHAYLFNQRSDIQRLPLEEKIKTFYTIGSNDPYVNDVISKTKTLGYGVLPGFRQSASDINQEMSGQIAPVAQKKS